MKQINEKEFADSIKDGITVVDFFATWCGPCRMMAPILEDVEKDLGGKAKFFKVDVDDNEALARKFGIMSIPTIMVFENGEQREKHIGLWQHDDAVDTIRSYLK